MKGYKIVFHTNLKKEFNLKVIFFITLITSIMLYVFDETKILGLVALSLVLASSFLYFIVHIDRIKVTNLFFTWFVYLTYGSMTLARDTSSLGINVFLKHIIMLFFVTILSQIRLNDYILLLVSKYFTWVYNFIIVSIIFNEIFFDFEWISLFLYKMTIMCTYFAIIRTNKVYKYSIITIIILSLTSTRSAILSIVLFLLMYKWMDISKKSKKIYKLTFFIGLIIIIGIPIIYSQLFYTDFGTLLNSYSRELFNKNFFSGRQYIWGYIISFVSRNPWFGYGFSNNLLNSFGITASTHNLYFALLIQGGILLLALFLVFMYQIWMKFFYYLDNRIVKTSAAFLLPILLRADFDLILLENDLVISVFLWIPLIIGIAYTNNLDNRKNKRDVYKKRNARRNN